MKFSVLKTVFCLTERWKWEQYKKIFLILTKIWMSQYRKVGSFDKLIKDKNYYFEIDFSLSKFSMLPLQLSNIKRQFIKTWYLGISGKRLC